jgi:hydroxymethylpyrimidine pyrophosphatase-like HAD family hydrolase
MIVIIDIDNTLCLNNKRFQLAKTPNGKTDWDIAHTPELVEQDEPNFPMIDLAHRYKRDGLKVVILTGRPDSIRKVTELWLMKYHIEYDALYMRTEADHYKKASIFKKQIYENYINDKVFCAFDDDEEIIKMWNSLGIPTFKVYGIQ